MIETEITVSVVMISYNHEDYIKEAIEGVLMQKCNFNVELIIADDNSPDYTEEVVNDIIKNHKNGHWIKYVKHSTNKGMMPNFIWTLNECKGKYIAICEGDDYWVDPYKLQKQIDFLENNPDFKFSMGRVDMLIEKTGEIKERKKIINPDKREFFTIRDYLKRPFSQTSSFIFRNENTSLPEWIYKVHAGDQSLVVLKTGLNGKIKYHKDLLSIYRINENSITFKADYNSYAKLIVTLDYWQEYLNYGFKNIFKLRRLENKSLSNYKKYNNIIWKTYSQVKLKVIQFLLRII